MSAPVTSSPPPPKNPATPPLQYAVETEEFTESVLKWVWLAWMIFAVSMFLPAVSGFFRGGALSPKGYLLAQAAHSVVYDFVLSGVLPGRRIRPFTPREALGIGMMGTLANWLIVSCGCAALLAVRRKRSKLILRFCAVGALVAAVCASASALIIIESTDLTALPGIYAWCAAPWLLSLGLARRAWRPNPTP